MPYFTKFNCHTLVLILLFSAVLAGSPQKGFAFGKKPVIDSSSLSSYFASVNAIRNRLNEDEKVLWNKAVKLLMLEEDPESPDDFKPSRPVRGMMKEMDGKTFNQVIETALKLKVGTLKNRLATVNADLDWFERQKNDYNKTKSGLSGIVIKAPAYHWEEASPGFFLPVVAVTVTNNSPSDITGIVFHGVVTTKDKKGPWIDGELRGIIPGGLKRGETRELKFQQMPYSIFAMSPLKDRKDAIIELRVLNALDKDNAYLATAFSLNDQKRLDDLRLEKAELQRQISYPKL